MFKRHNAFCILVLACALALSACGGKSAGPSAYSGPPAMDVLTLPQDLAAYAPAAGGSRSLVDAQTQAASAMRQKEAHYRPWRLTKPPRWIKDSLQKDFNMKADKAYTDGKKPFPADEWQRIVANSNKNAYGKTAKPGITLQHTNLRAAPTSMRFYYRPDLPGEGYPFDYLQQTSVPPGTPVYICNVSGDGLWLLVQCPATAGWLPAADVAEVSEAFMERWQSRPLAALVRDNVSLPGTRGHIGALLPLAEGGGLLFPERGASGHADIGVANVAYGDYEAVPMTLSADNVARVGNRMMGQAYTWGGLDEKRDCSALTRDLFAPFGLYLPRNSGSQAKVGLGVPLAGMSNAEKEAAIKSSAAPFKSLIWLKGHIGVYLGQYEGKALLFHNMWGLRTRDKSGGCDNRAVVGKAVVTTLKPGVERPDLCNSGSLLDRIGKAVVLLE